MSPRTAPTTGTARALLNAPSAARAVPAASSGSPAASAPAAPAASVASRASVGASTLAINTACRMLTSNRVLAAATVRAQATGRLSKERRSEARQRPHSKGVWRRRPTQNKEVRSAIWQTVSTWLPPSSLNCGWMSANPGRPSVSPSPRASTAGLTRQRDASSMVLSSSRTHQLSDTPITADHRYPRASARASPNQIEAANTPVSAASTFFPALYVLHARRGPAAPASMGFQCEWAAKWPRRSSRRW